MNCWRGHGLTLVWIVAVACSAASRTNNAEPDEPAASDASTWTPSQASD